MTGGEPGGFRPGRSEIPTIDGGGNGAGIMTRRNHFLTKENQMPLLQIWRGLSRPGYVRCTKLVSLAYPIAQ